MMAMAGMPETVRKFAFCQEYFICLMHRGFFTWSGLNLSYLEAGDQNSPKLLIAHANGYAAGCYDYLIPELAGQYHVCALDFAGHGASQGTLDFSSWNFFRDQILAFIDHMGWENCTAIGHSLGAGSLLRAAIEDSGRFTQIIAFDPVMLGFLSIAYVKLFGNPMARTALNRRSRFKNKAQALKIFERHPANRSWEKDSIRAYVEYCIRSVDGAAELCCDPKIESRIFSQTEYAHLFRLGRIHSETHLVLPPRSNVCPTWVARRVTKGHPHSGMERIAGTGHLLPFENRKLTLDIVKKHLQL
jgi:pimeloyl-ACP methyl ester carboxylesterase